MAKLIAPIASHTVYVLCSPTTSRVYYGCTGQPDLEDRTRHHMQALARGYHGNDELQLAHDTDPIGWAAHELARLPEAEALDLEAALIEGDRNCFNIRHAGKQGVTRVPVDADMLKRIKDMLGTTHQYQIAKTLGVSMSQVSRVSRNIHPLQVTA